MRVDVDGDGLDEVVAQTPRGLALMDPRRDWKGVRVATARAVPLAATPWPAGRSAGSARIAWLEPATERPGTIGTETVTRDPDDGTLTGSPVTVSFAGGMSDDRWSVIEATSLAAASLQRPLVGWLGNLVDADCPDLVLPGSVQGCTSDTLRPGAAWVTSRPLALFGDERRRLLVASGVAIDLETGLMQVPTPAAVDLPGWWRHGPSADFVLAELRSDDAIYYREFPSPRATVERTATADTGTTVPGFTGVRFVLAAAGEAEGAPDAVGHPALREALTTVRKPTSYTVVGRVPVPPGVDAGRDGSSARIDLSSVTGPGGGPVDQWQVTIIPINDWGEVGAPARGTIRRDQAAPFVSITIPFTTPVWPARATLAGTVEPGATVEVEGVGLVDSDRRGRFTFETSLAPWPQIVRVTATDASGNRTVHEASIVGGIDYRAFPWPTIMAIALLAAVVASGVVGTRRQRVKGTALGPPRRDFDDDGSGPELVELPPGGGLGATRQRRS
jgi:hypothetical protein